MYVEAYVRYTVAPHDGVWVIEVIILLGHSPSNHTGYIKGRDCSQSSSANKVTLRKTREGKKELRCVHVVIIIIIINFLDIKI